MERGFALDNRGLDVCKGTDIVLKAFERIAPSEDFHFDLYGAIVDQAYQDWVARLEKSFPTKMKYHGQDKADIAAIANTIDMALYLHILTRTTGLGELLYSARASNSH